MIGIESRLRDVDAIVIGASAGGVEALSILLPALPRDTRVPVVIVLHQPPEGPSLLVELFTPKCAVAVREAEDKAPVEAGTVYFAPPNYHVLVDVGPQLVLSADPPVNYSRPSIDVLFESAADLYAARLLGIILSGANADGAAGLAAIEHAGGVAVVQTPQKSYASAMPEAALRHTPAAYVLPLPQIAALLCAPPLAAARKTGEPWSA